MQKEMEEGEEDQTNLILPHPLPGAMNKNENEVC